MLAYGETYIRGAYGFAFDAGLGIDFDFYPRFSVPLGLVITYDISFMPDFVNVDGEESQMVQLKVAYTKASDFSLGLEFSYMNYPFLNQTKQLTTFSTALAARYYF